MTLERAGVYTITCVPTGVQYVGSAVRFSRRFRQHMSDLNLGRHKSTYMQRAWAKYGPDAFVFSVLLVCDPRLAVYFEQRAIDRLDPRFNTARVAGSSLGIKRTAEQCAMQGRLRTEINLAKPDRGIGHMLPIVQSEQFRQKQSERMKLAHARGDYADAQKRRGEKREKRHVVHGEALTIKQLAARYGRTVKSIQRRIERGVVGDEIVAPAYKVTRHGQ